MKPSDLVKALMLGLASEMPGDPLKLGPKCSVCGAPEGTKMPCAFCPKEKKEDQS